MNEFPVKVGIVGTHSTGKSSVIESARASLEAVGYRVTVVPSNLLRTRDAGFSILAAHTFESTLFTICDQISAELVAMQSTDVVLIDRPVIDALIYYQAALAYRGDEAPQAGIDLLRTIVSGYSFTYAVLFRTVLDKTRPMGTGKKRDSNVAFREMVDSMAEEVAADVGCLLTRLPQDHNGAVLQIVESIHVGMKLA